ncbi:MAG: hypothetical protein MJB57_05970 [Gemmatimonadetes bacterium]|nr:hypothetical protein [Gemmatimonadota bacterium]
MTSGRGASRRIPIAAILVAMTLLACGETGSTDLGTPPAALIPVSLAADTVVTGEATDPPISVRVEDALGNAIEGAPVRFIVARGEGTLSPGVAVSGQDGVAESAFRAGGSPGESEIRVDIPSAPNIAPLSFLVLAEAADSVVFSVVEGADQRAEVGSQLARAFVVRATMPGGGPAGGVEVVFRLDGNGETSAVLTDEVATTSADGRARTVLTLGREARDYTVDVFAGTGVYSDTARFVATATASFDGAIALDSVASDAMRSGAQATLFGRGFSPVPTQNDVRIEGEPAEVVAASGTELTIQVPTFDACLPARRVGVRVLVGADASNGELVELQPSQPALDLAIGETTVLRGPTAVECLQFSPSEAPREYRLVVGNTSRVATDRLSLRVTTRVPAEADEGAISTSVARREIDAGLRERALTASRPDLLIRSQALDALTRGRVAAARAPGAGTRPTLTPSVGDSLEHFFSVGADLAATCSDTANVVRGVVRAVGDHVALVEDIEAPSGGLNEDEWGALGIELDQIVVPVDTAYFGGYADIDGNGRLIVLFTPEVNKLGDGEAGIGGFFLPLDLAASGRGGDGLPGPAGETCPASNEAEILYIITADPEGRVGPTIDKDRALRNALGLVAHELQHLINAERRVLRAPNGFAAAEEVWLDEALSQLAEEVVGLATIGLGVGGNYTFDQVANTRVELDAFNTYQLSNFLNLSFYMFDPSIAPTISPVDPGGVGGLQMRGFGWFMLRWLADQAGGDERAMFRSLVGGGQNFVRGIDNIERVTGREWADVLSAFSVSIAADDSGIDELPSEFEIATWDFRDVFASLSQNTAARSLFPVPFPLQATRLGLETAALDFDVGASGVRYFALASGLDAPALSVSLQRSRGGALNENTEPQITIVRTR